MVSLEKPVEWAEARGYRTAELWAYLTSVFDNRGQILYNSLRENEPLAFHLMLVHHFRYDNVTGELVDRG